MKPTFQSVFTTLKIFALQCILCLSVLSPAALFAQNPSPIWSSKLGDVKRFVENKSQFNGKNLLPGTDILYAAELGGTRIFFTKDGLTYRLDEIEHKDEHEEWEERMDEGYDDDEEYEKEESEFEHEMDVVHMQWVNHSPEVNLVALEQTDDYFSYTFGDRNAYQNINYIKGYKKLVYQNLYPNIDVEYTFHPEEGIKYAIILHPGADPSQIQMRFSDSDKILEDKTGKIQLGTLFGDIIEHAPVTYYSGNSSLVIPSRFVKRGQTFSFYLAAYDNTKTVVIDPWVQTPILANSNGVWECEKDGVGNVYIIGGDSPMKLLKYNNAGALQWTYVTPWDTLNNWLGTFATDLAGNSYVTSGSIAAMQKVNTNGGLVWSVNGGPLDEYWSIAFNCDQTKLVVGGTRLGFFPPAGSHGVIFDINTNNGNVISLINVASLVPRPLISDINEVRAITSSRNAKYYYLTLDTIGAINQNLSACSNVPLFSINSTYNFAYKCENYRPSNGNSGICAIRANAQFVYSQNGTVIHKRSPVTGAILTSATIPGGISVAVPFFGTNQAGNSGIDLDDCGNVYVGSGDRVIKYDANLNLITSVALPFRVYDVTVNYNGEIIVAGATGNNSIANRTGYVQVLNMSACAPFALICCDATVCPVSPYCTSDAPFNLTPVQAGGTWSGPGITNPLAGTFSPAVAGVGIHKITYSLSCGSDTVSITVNDCAALSVCVESNGQYTVSGGTGPYTWESGVPFQNCAACPFGICFPPICNGFPDTTWTTFATGATVTPPGTFPIRVRDSGINSLEIDDATGLISCGPICPPIIISIVAQKNVTCFRFNDGSATVTASGGQAPYTYIWQPGNLTGPTQTSLVAGTYGITASDANRCTGTASITITSPTEVVLVTSQANASCDNNDGSASVTPSGGTPPYTYSWTTGASTPSISGLSAGNYGVTVYDANSCFASASFNITSPQGAQTTQDISICDGESFFAGGANQTTSGTYYDTLVAASGCDSVVITNLTVSPKATFTQDISICDGDSVFAGGEYRFTSGTYYDTLVAANSCDSIVTTNLTVLQTVSETVDASICDGDAYYAGGDFQTTSGTYYDTLTAAAGCDSIVITNLTVLPNYSISQDVSICDGESYFVGGASQTTSGTYYDSLVASTGCDSVLITNLTVLPHSFTTQDVSICSGDSLFVGGEFQTTTGTYYDTLVAANGCDSIMTTNLTVLQNVSFTVDASICDGDAYYAGGDFQTTSGTYYDTLTASGGCDSIVITNLTILPNYSITQDVSICDGESYFVGGANQTTSGTYYDSLLSVAGCDSVIITNLTVLPTSSTTQDASICDGESFLAGGDFQTTSGTYYDSLIAANGCDSVVITNLTVLPNVATTNDVSICSGDSLFAGGAFQTTTGTYYDTLTAANGCDSTVTTNLTVLQNVSETVDASICDGDAYYVGGDFQTTSGTYYDTLTASGGCDSIVITNLTVLPNYTVNQDVSICDGESYFVGGANQTVSGTYYDSLLSAEGCDSVLVTNLTVLTLSFSTIDASICDGESYFAGGGFQTQAGSYYDTLPGANGCDSIVTTNLTILPLASTTIDASICDGESFFVGGGFQTQAGTYYDTLAAANGCDSIVTTNLTILPHSSTIIDASICDGESYLAGGDFQTTSGTYYDTLAAANGCDSVVTTNLTVLPNSATTIDTAICDGESYLVGEDLQTTTGTYFDTLPSANGCDSVITTNLTVNPQAVASFVASSDVICFGQNISFTNSSTNADSYLWDFGDGSTSNLSEPTHTYTTPGNYTVSLSAFNSNGCNDAVSSSIVVLIHTSSTIDASICDGESYFAGGGFQTEAGTYYDTLVASNGCDSVVTTNLTILPNSTMNIDATICNGESYFAGGAFQTEKGLYYDTLVAANGCDSIVITNLIVLPNPTTTQDISICEGDSYFVGGADQTTAGMYYDTLVAANGCDSIVTTNLVVIPTVTTTIDTTICDGSGYFAGGEIQTISGTYYDTLTASSGCDSVIITNLTISTTIGFSFNITDASCNGLCDGEAECTISGGQEPIAFDWSNGDTSAVNSNLCADTYGITVMDANGCSAESFATVGESAQLIVNTSQQNISCNCSNSVTTQGICVIDFTGLPAGTVLDEQYAQYGIHISGDVYNSTTVDKVIVFNSNATGTPDPDLEVNLGNLAILPQNITDLNGDGLIDAPNDNNFGGKQVYLFDIPRDVISFIFVDKESPAGLAVAYDSLGNVIKTVTIPSAGNGSVQTIMMNAQGVSKLVIDYRYDSGGITQITLGCATQCCDAEASCEPTGGTAGYSFEWSNGSTQQNLTNLCAGNYDVTVTDANGCQSSASVQIPEFEAIELEVTHQDATSNCTPVNQLCELDFAGLPAGTLLNEQYAQYGIHISGDAYSNYPDQVIIFNADATGTPDPDLEPATGNLAIFPERLMDANGDGLVDIPNDQGSGGKMIFSFDQETEVISFVFVDKENNNPGMAKAYDANNQIIKIVNIPNRGDGSVQTVNMNASGVRKLVLDYRDSGGVTQLRFGCNTACCDGSASASATGGTPPLSFEWSNGDTTATVDSLCAGSYSVTVTDADGCSSTQSFNIGDCSLSITGMALVHAGFSQDIAPLTDGEVISLDTLCPFNIRTIPCQPTIGSIKFKINGVFFRTEEYDPFALAGDYPTGNYHPWYPQPGEYTIDATPYSGMNATGTAGSTFTIHFTVVAEPCVALKTAIDNLGANSFDLDVYPNPFNDMIMVEVTTNNDSKATLKVTDIIGMEIMKQDVNLVGGKNTIPIPAGDWLPKALYFLEVRIQDQMKVVKLEKVK